MITFYTYSLHIFPFNEEYSSLLFGSSSNQIVEGYIKVSDANFLK